MSLQSQCGRTAPRMVEAMAGFQIALCLAAVSCALPLALVVVEPAGEALVSESPEPNPSVLTSRHSVSKEHDL